MLKTKKEIAYFIALLVVAIAIIGVILFGIHMQKKAADAAAAATPMPTAAEDISSQNEKNQVSFDTVQESLRSMSELTTEEYVFTEVVSDTKLKPFLGINFSWRESSFIASYDGIVRAGIDFSKITVQATETAELDGKTRITIKIPKAEILGTEIDRDSFVLYSEKTGLGNPLSASDFNESLVGLQKDVETKAEEKGVLKKAQDNAKLLIGNFVKNLLPGEEYIVEVVVQ